MATKKVIKNPAKKVAAPKKKAPIPVKKAVKASVVAPVKKSAPAKAVEPKISSPPTKSAAMTLPKNKMMAKSGKIQTAEGWKRMIVNKLGKKRPGKSLI